MTSGICLLIGRGIAYFPAVAALRDECSPHFKHMCHILGYPQKDRVDRGTREGEGFRAGPFQLEQFVDKASLLQ